MTDNRLGNYSATSQTGNGNPSAGRIGSTLKGTCLVLSLINAGLAVAGGMERGGYNIDRLFDPAKFSFYSSASAVNPRRKLDHVKDTYPKNGTFDRSKGFSENGVSETESYVTPYAGIKIAFGDHVDCLLDYSQPWGAHTHPGTQWAGVNSNIEIKIDSDNYGATCSYKFPIGNNANIRLIGGGFHQKIDGFKIKQVGPQEYFKGNGQGRTSLKSSGNGYRIGIAYEIPEIAMRTSLLYNSSVSHDLSGITDLSQLDVDDKIIPIFGETKAPQTLEFKMQSGIAPGWLAFGSIKWVDWSVVQSIPLCPKENGGICTTKMKYPEKTTSLDMLFRDGYTLAGGIGHQINDKWNVGASLSYDRGTQKGFGDQTDTYSLGALVQYKPMKHCTLSLGGSFGVLTSGHSGKKIGKDGETYGENASYDFGNDIFTALYASLKVDF